ncbi:unnamed protein product [Spirodela intermedia]|uniref:SHSP domain-containing protein n=2 Tax=Spirodela intermedia TaxID=51605 RepID=A0A7I8JF57_SPIIN|nr:unnamed protein product [Spirodela intermedia]CAA6668759.1 unnamed protein product [Spirodela intermedia]CAA7405653.1 unnamed protein product [Spirodela intermedia]
MAASGRSLEVVAGDGSPRKWSMSLKEDVFAAFLAGDDGGAAARRVFAEASLFSPLLFGSFFDPADAFPLWDFDPDAILAARRGVGWSETAAEYVLTAALPEAAREDLAVAVEKGRVVEISGRWRRRRRRREEDSGERSDWRAGEWWELGFVRRLELPEDARPATAVAAVDGSGLLEIRIPRRSSSPEAGGADGRAAEP